MYVDVHRVRGELPDPDSSLVAKELSESGSSPLTICIIDIIGSFLKMMKILRKWRSWRFLCWRVSLWMAVGCSWKSFIIFISCFSNSAVLVIGQSDMSDGRVDGELQGPDSLFSSASPYHDGTSIMQPSIDMDAFDHLFVLQPSLFTWPGPVKIYKISFAGKELFQWLHVLPKGRTVKWSGLWTWRAAWPRDNCIQLIAKRNELYLIVSGSGSPQMTWMHLCIPTNSRDIEIYGI